jgi:hypothetical protein
MFSINKFNVYADRKEVVHINLVLELQLDNYTIFKKLLNE